MVTLPRVTKKAPASGAFRSPRLAPLSFAPVIPPEQAATRDVSPTIGQALNRVDRANRIAAPTRQVNALGASCRIDRKRIVLIDENSVIRTQVNTNATRYTSTQDPTRHAVLPSPSELFPAHSQETLTIPGHLGICPAARARAMTRSAALTIGRSTILPSIPKAPLPSPSFSCAA